ncbi:23S rRNA (adenine(2030)-N(6))-methyltransferase RlmJ [Hyphobacterium marinum]|uniref:Ribosomal RNA large subunit methyltransferase J n=1 Tax=Hyphobacterium marinum TaxID=3116574 RepID=A0ABU7LX92_9PROT|nr:23S rRNA (adenine(2030)-N(6))-methyltransferase RlmJ [Hyphobacterium sp. Y6023]MEE2566139.1 23S rRNA (adenine(2030)-N(6))-methyltransferase RlmJ [Hyphobacterium sp. Y6023]
MESLFGTGYSDTMNYRHAFHAGNFADVLKHAVIAQCLDHLKAKPKPFRVIDSHAGVGAYDLTGDAARRSPEWQAGIARVLETKRPAAVEAALAPYLKVVKAMNTGADLTAYPGSPELAARLMRQDDRAHLCELHEADAKTLDARYARDARIKVERRDGYKALGALVPPREKRGLVLVDPPFEHRDEMAHMAEAIKPALTKWPTGTFVFWRPLKDLWASERFDVGLAEWLFEEGLAAPEKILRADLWVRDLESEGKLAGAGVVVINPPFTLEGHLLALLPWLAEALAQGDGAGWRLDGAVTDDSLSVEEF